MPSKIHLAKNLAATGRQRVIIKNVQPSVPDGFPAKGSERTPVHFTANIITDGHELLYARVLYRYQGEKEWQVLPLTLCSNDLWHARLIPERTGVLEFRLQAWISDWLTWRDAYAKKEQAGQDMYLERMKGASLLEATAGQSSGQLRRQVQEQLKKAGSGGAGPEDIEAQLFRQLVDVVEKDRVTTSPVYTLVIERRKAGFSTWYELFPRSSSPEPGRHGTFNDVAAVLPRLADAGFDVLYLPPIHPIGKVKRKGRNNSLEAGPADPGSPWAIGSDEGGHKSLHPELGSMEDFKMLVKKARKLDIDIAMDIAFQCAPDHPYVQQQPAWFKWRADGTVQFAENPPKKYEDILPFDFDSKDWQALWEELLSIFMFWAGKGVRVFRVDNPHTKPLGLWEWIIASVHKEYPDVIFLAEAFTRPHIMEHLAMAGFTQSYTYFTWRNTKQELQAYMLELTRGPKQHFFRPNFWPNTPDILPAHLVSGGANAHVIRLLLAATLSSNYGLYGPVYERGINTPAPGKEEYTDNEKYEIKYWEPAPESRTWQVIRQVNHIRRSFTALQVTNNISFADTSNDQIMAYIKWDELQQRHLLIVITLDPHHAQSAWITIPEKLRKLYGHTLHIHDELNEEEYSWQEERNYVALDPSQKPAHIFSFKNQTA